MPKSPASNVLDPASLAPPPRALAAHAPAGPDRLRERAREWAIWLTRQRSVTGTDGERDLPSRLIERIAQTIELRDAEAWVVPCPGDGLGRSSLALLARGTGEDTLLLTGHFDTVTTADYDDLAELATEPEALREALIDRLANATTPAERLALADLEGGDFLPGRGLLDMKAGLAAALAAMETFLADPDRRGNLLFIAVPDEEVNSVGARAVVEALPAMTRERGIRLSGAINLDCIAETGDGSRGRAVATGSVGKLLLTAFVVGRSAHASSPFEGLNAGALAGAIAARIEWAPELADAGIAADDGTDDGSAIPPVLLTVKDGKAHYDVTTPDAAFATWNVLTKGRPADEVLASFTALVGDAVAGFRDGLARRRAAVLGGSPEDRLGPAVPLVAAEAFTAAARAVPGGAEKLDTLGRALAAANVSIPDQAERLTRESWRMSGRPGPAVVIGFGSIPYPAVMIGNGADAQRLMAAIRGAIAERVEAGAPPVAVTGHFPGISDMSFIGEARVADLALIARHTPAWDTGVAWSGAVGGVPTVNIGPWGRDYHTPLERVHEPYAFRDLPALLLAIARHHLTP